MKHNHTAVIYNYQDSSSGRTPMETFASTIINQEVQAVVD